MKLKQIVAMLMAAGVVSAPTLVLAAGAADLSSCCTPADTDYPTPGGNLGNQNYSSLTQMNKSNIKNVGPVWMTRVSAAPATTPSPSPGTDDGGQQTMPIAVDGVIYMDTPVGDVIAVDGATGAVKWKWHPTAFPPVNNDRRGVSVGDGKVYTLAGNGMVGYRVVALDKNTGAEIWVRQPTDPAGQSFGNIQKVATVYYDGMVYVGTNDGTRNAIFALRSSDGALVWFFFGADKPELWDSRVFTDVNGNIVRADATSWGPDPNCAETVGDLAMDPWLDRSRAQLDHGRVRQRAQLRLVAGWLHAPRRQPVRQYPRIARREDRRVQMALPVDPSRRMGHGQHPLARACGRERGRPDAQGRVVRQQVGSHFQHRPHQRPAGDRCRDEAAADRFAAAEPDDAAVPGVGTRDPGMPGMGEARPEQHSGQSLARRAELQRLPGRLHRRATGPTDGDLVYTEPNYLDPDKPFVTIPPEYGANHRKGCMYDTHWDLPVLSTTSQNGGMDWSGYSFSPQLNTLFIPYGINPVAHWRGAGGNGQRALGQYQTGGLFAMDASTTQMKWNKFTGLDMAHGQTPVTTASNLLFIGQFDGNALALDAETGDELWRFQTGAAISSPPVIYSVNGEQYVAFFAGGTGIPYGNSVTSSDMLWAFKLGGTFKTASGSQENPTPSPLTIRRPVGGTARRRKLAGSSEHRVSRPRQQDAGRTEPERHEPRGRHGRGCDEPDADARSSRHDGHVPEPGRGHVPELPQHEATLRDAVLRGPVQLQAQPRPVGAIHVQSCRRVLLQRLH